MKNKKKILLAMVATAVLLVVALAVTIGFLRSREETSGPVQMLTTDVFALEVSQMKALEVYGPDGVKSRIELNGAYNGTLEGVDPNVELDTMTMSLLVSKFTNVRTYHDPIQLGEENTLDHYGLEDPYGSFIIEQMDGTRTKLLVGDQTVKKNGYYLYVEGGSQVYIVENAYYEYLKYSRDDFIDKQLAAVDQDSGFTITQLSIKNRARDYEAITVRMRFGEYQDNSIYLYEVVEPEYHSGDDYKIHENIFTYLNPLKGIGVYSLDVSEENLVALGLAEPQYVLSYINEGVEREFHFAQLPSGEMVGMKAGGYVILEMDPQIRHMLEIQVADVSNAYVLLQSIAQLDAFTVEDGNNTWEFSLEAAEDKLASVIWNGAELDVEAFRDLYSLAMEIKVAGDIPDPEAKGEHLLTLTYHCSDGTVQRVDYYDYDGRYGYVTLNDAGRFLVRLSAIEDFTNCLLTLTGEAA